MSACLIVIGSLYARFGVRTETEVKLQSTVAQWFVIVLTYIFVANFSWSWAVVSLNFYLIFASLPVIFYMTVMVNLSMLGR